MAPADGGTHQDCEGTAIPMLTPIDRDGEGAALGVGLRHRVVRGDWHHHTRRRHCRTCSFAWRMQEQPLWPRALPLQRALHTDGQQRN